jgi:hypothetical protein
MHATVAQPHIKPRSRPAPITMVHVATPAPSTPAPVITAVPIVGATVPEASPAATSACANRTVNEIADNGATLIASDGQFYHISSQGMMRFDVAHWTAGDAIVVCRTGDSASISNAARGDTAQADNVP